MYCAGTYYNTFKQSLRHPYLYHAYYCLDYRQRYRNHAYPTIISFKPNTYIYIYLLYIIYIEIQGVGE